MRLILLFLLACPLILKGQEHDTIRAEAMYKKANLLTTKGYYDTAIDQYLKGAEIWLAHGNWERHLWGHVAIVSNYNSAGRLDNADGKALELFPAIADKLGENSQLESLLHLEHGITCYYRSDYDCAIESFIKTAEIREINLGKNHPKVAEAYNNIGIMYDETYNQNQAIRYYQQALRIWQEDPVRHKATIGAVYNNLSIAYGLLSEYQKSLEAARASLKIKKDLHGMQRVETAFAYTAVANALQNLEDYDEALLNYERALDIINVAEDPKSGAVGHTSLSMASLYLIKEDYEKCNDLYDVTLRSFERTYGSNSIWVALTYNGKGDMYYQSEDYEKALDAFQKSLTINISGFSDTTDTFQNPEIKNYLRAEEVLVSMEGKAKIFRALYDQTHDNAYLEATRDIYLRVDGFLSEIRSERTDELDKLRLAESFYSVSLGGLESSLKLLEVKGTDKYLNEAFHFMERNRSNILSSILFNKNAGLPDELIDTYLKEEKEIRANLSNYRSILISNPADSVVNAVNDSIFAWEERYEKLVQTLQARYPDYYNLRYNIGTSSIPDLQDKLSDDQAFIEYFDGDSTVYALVVTSEAKQFFTVNKPDDFENQIEGFKKSITPDPNSCFKQRAHELYQLVFQPLAVMVKDKNKLLIVPDGTLWGLNFDLLMSEPSTSEDYRRFQYLIKDYNISYAYSAGLYLQEYKSRPDNTINNKVLAFSFGDADGDAEDQASGDKLTLRSINDTNEDLPGSRYEIAAISEVMEGDYYYGSVASEANFKNEAPKYGILHLALHGEINDQEPDNSRLYFNASQDSIQDNYLHAFELYNLGLNAEMVVLSACNTGEGKIVKGEGIMSLGRAFTYAGVRSLVVTQWEVPDRYTPEIIKGFYAGLNEGLSKNEALRQAKLSFLENTDPTTANPFYWGSFVLIGDNSPLENSRSPWPIVIGILLLAGLILFFRLWFNKRSFKARLVDSI
ncbi:MAG: CHAT domain-containing tetratricopeptide repeat protein [Bacteroidota bacterium]